MSAPKERLWRPPFALSLPRTLSGLCRGPREPSMCYAPDGSFWRATRTPEGPSTTRYLETEEGLLLQAWGDGADWSLEHGPELLGATDTAEQFSPSGKLGALQRRYPGMRMPRTRSVYEACLRSVLEQKVTGKEARLAYDAMFHRYGEPAPGPMALTLAPRPEVLAAVPYYDLHPLGIEMRRAETLRRVAAAAERLDQTPDRPLAEAQATLQSIPGIGEWTTAEVSILALGDADAVSVGDYHLKNKVTFAFTGRARGSDEEMLELLAPHRPHRARVIRLIEAAGIKAPAFGPRQRLRSFRRF